MEEQSAPLPDATTLLNNYAALVLGQFDTAAHQTRYTRHHTDLVPGFTVTVEKFQRAPAELVQKTTAVDGSMIVMNGYDGNVAWQMHEGVARIVTDAEADVLKQTADLYYGLLPAPAAMLHTRGSVTLGEVRLDDEAAYAISLPGLTLAAAEAGGLPIAYISKSTGLLMSATMGAGTQNFSVRQTFGAYRDFGGLLVATESMIASHVETNDFKQSITIDELRWDCVPASEFELPEEVRALITP